MQYTITRVEFVAARTVDGRFYPPVYVNEFGQRKWKAFANSSCWWTVTLSPDDRWGCDCPNGQINGMQSISSNLWCDHVWAVFEFYQAAERLRPATAAEVDRIRKGLRQQAELQRIREDQEVPTLELNPKRKINLEED